MCVVGMTMCVVGMTEREISLKMSFLADEVAPSKVEGACREILYGSLRYGRDDKVCGRDDRMRDIFKNVIFSRRSRPEQKVEGLVEKSYIDPSTTVGMTMYVVGITMYVVGMTMCVVGMTEK